MRTLLNQALADATGIIETIGAYDFRRPTPCTDWDLGQLLTHLLGELTGFTLAVSDGNAPADRFLRNPVEPANLQQDWRRASTALCDAIATADLESTVVLGVYGSLPVAVVLRMQLLDTAVHNWDLATTLGRSYHPGEATATTIEELAETIIARPAPSTVFATPTTPGLGSDQNAWHQALRLLGRTP